MTLAPVSPWEVAASLFEPTPVSPYLRDPVGWVHDKLGEFLWSKQREVCESVVNHRKTVVRSCHNAGKSRVASRLAAWFIDVHPPGEAFVISTAPTFSQVHGILWEEIRNAAKVADARGNPLPGRVLGSDQWKLDDGTLIGWGRKPADTDQHGFQGIHRRYILVVVDEGCGIPRQLWTAVEAVTTGANVTILALGNPDDPNTEFADISKPGSGWNSIRISAFDTPNLSGEDIPEDLKPMMLDPEWVEDKRRRWGEESPRYVSKILGEFPEIGDDVLISPALIRAAQERALEPSGASVLGVDVARFGIDRTVIYLRQGPVIRKVGEWAKQATTDTAGRVIAAQRESGAGEIRIDGVGVGGGVVDQLTEQGYSVLDMQAGAAAQDRERFANARSEWAWMMRELLESEGVDLDDLDDDLAAELGSFKYKYDSRGRIVVESKAEMRKRGLPSPDHADAAILTAVTPQGADLFRRMAWRHWTYDGAQIVTGGRHWNTSEQWVFATAHLPVGDEALSDMSVVAVWARSLDGDLLLLDRARWRSGEEQAADQVRPLVARWRPDALFVPKKQRTEQLTAELAQVASTIPLDVEPDRMARAFPASAMQSQGRVWLPAEAWSESVKSEMLAFPNSRHTGMVETLSSAVRVVVTRWVPPPTKQAAPASTGELDFMSMPL